MTIPTPFFGGYLAGWHGLLPNSLPSEINFLLYGFAQYDSNRVPFIPYGQSAANMKVQNDARRNLSPPKYMILSIGGAEGTEGGVVTQAHEDNLVSGLITLCTNYGFSGIDWDIEGSDAGASSTSRIFNVSKRVKDHFVNVVGRPFYVTIVPYGSVETTYREWAEALWPDYLDMVLYQHYNGGQAPTAAEIRNEINSWKSMLPGMTNADYGMGHVYSHVWPSSATKTPYTTMRDTWNDVKATHPGLGGIWAWDIAPAAYGSDTDVNQFVNVVYPSVGAPAGNNAASVPSAPTSASVTAVEVDRGTLNWQPPISNGGATISGYRVEIYAPSWNGGIPWSTTVSASVRSFTFTNLFAETQYRYRVSAINAVGTGTYAQRLATTDADGVVEPPPPDPADTAPGVPQTVVAVPVSTSSVRLSWTPPASDGGSAITGYGVLIASPGWNDGVAWATTVSAGAREFTFGSLKSGQTYTASVEAINGVGRSAMVDAAPVTTPPSFRTVGGTLRFVDGAAAIDEEEPPPPEPLPDPDTGLVLYGLGDYASTNWPATYRTYAKMRTTWYYGAADLGTHTPTWVANNHEPDEARHLIIYPDVDPLYGSDNPGGIPGPEDGLSTWPTPRGDAYGFRYPILDLLGASESGGVWSYTYDDIDILIDAWVSADGPLYVCCFTEYSTYPFENPAGDSYAANANYYEQLMDVFEIVKQRFQAKALERGAEVYLSFGATGGYEYFRPDPAGWIGNFARALNASDFQSVQAMSDPIKESMEDMIPLMNTYPGPVMIAHMWTYEPAIDFPAFFDDQTWLEARVADGLFALSLMGPGNVIGTAYEQLVADGMAAFHRTQLVPSSINPDAVPPAASFATLTDDFEGTVDTSVWYMGEATNQANGRMNVVASLSYGSQMLSHARYDLTGTEVGIDTAAFPAAGIDSYYSITYTGNDDGLPANRLTMIRTSSDLLLRKTVENVNTDVIVAFDPVAMKFWRFREDAGVAYWETSPDGATWTTRHSEAAPFVLRSLHVQAMAHGASGQWEIEAINSTNAAALPAPTGLAGVADGTSAIDWSWNAVAGATSYEIEGNNGQWLENVGNVLTYSNGDLTPGQSTTLRVRAHDAAGPGSWSAPVTAQSAAASTKTATFSDDFTGTVIDPAKWTAIGAGVSQNDQLIIAGTTSYADHVWSTERWDLTESEFVINVAAKLGGGDPGVDASMETTIVLFNDASNAVTVAILPSTVICRVTEAGVATESFVGAASADTWWRISHTGTTVTMQSGVDGVTWTQRRVFTGVGAWVNDLQVQLTAAHWSANDTTAASAVPARFDNMNVPA